MNTNTSYENFAEDCLKHANSNNKMEQLRVLDAVQFLEENCKNYDEFSNEELFERFYQTKDPKICNMIYEKNIKILTNFVKNYVDKNIIGLDLFSNLSLAFLRSINNFNLSINTNFYNFSYCCLKHEVSTYYQIKGYKKNNDSNTFFIDDLLHYASSNFTSNLTNSLEHNFTTNITPEDMFDYQCSKQAIYQNLNKVFNRTLTKYSTEIVKKYNGIECERQNITSIADEYNTSYDTVLHTYHYAMNRIRLYLSKRPKIKEDLEEAFYNCNRIVQKYVVEQEKLF